MENSGLFNDGATASANMLQSRFNFHTHSPYSPCAPARNQPPFTHLNLSNYAFDLTKIDELRGKHPSHDGLNNTSQ